MFRELPSRILYIDSPVPPREDYEIYSVKTAEEAREFVSDMFGRSVPVFIDAQECSERVFGILLQFLEDYAGSVEMSATDPVPVTALSRFRTVRTSSLLLDEADSLEALRWKYQPTSIRLRMNTLFGAGERKHNRDGHRIERTRR